MEQMSSPQMGSNMSAAGQSDQHKHHNILAMVIFILVAVLITILLLFMIGWAEFNPPEDYFKRPVQSLQEETENIDLGNIDQEFMELDASINGL